MVKVNNTNKNILFVEQNQDGTIGGSYWCLYYIVKHLDKSKYKPFVIFFNNNKIATMLTEMGIKVIILEKPIAARWAKRTNKIINAVQLIIQNQFNRFRTAILPMFKIFYIYIKYKINLVHLNNTCQAGWEWFLPAKVLAIPCITHQRVYPDNPSKSALYLARHLDRIICITSLIKDSLYQLGVVKNTVVIRDAMDVNEFINKINIAKEGMRQDLGLDETDFVIGMVGNFQKWKGQHIVLDAFKQMKLDGFKAKLIFIGDKSNIKAIGADYYSDIQSAINDVFIKDDVIITGFVENVANYVNMLDVVVHASIKPEPFGMVVIEAMSLGKIVISTNVGGPVEIINPGKNGLLINPDDSKLLKQALIDVFKDSKYKKMGKNAQDRVNQVFDMSRQISEIETVYQQL